MGGMVGMGATPLHSQGGGMMGVSNKPGPPAPTGFPGGWSISAPPMQQHPMLPSTYQLSHLPPPIGLDYGLGPPQVPQPSAVSARGKERLRYITDPEVWRQAEIQAAAAAAVSQQYSSTGGLKGLAALTAAAPLSSFAKSVWPDIGAGGVITNTIRPQHNLAPTIPGAENESLLDDPNSDGDTSSVSGASGEFLIDIYHQIGGQWSV